MIISMTSKYLYTSKYSIMSLTDLTCFPIYISEIKSDQFETIDKVFQRIGWGIISKVYPCQKRNSAVVYFDKWIYSEETYDFLSKLEETNSCQFIHNPETCDSWTIRKAFVNTNAKVIAERMLKNNV